MKALWNKGLSKIPQDFFLINYIFDKCIEIHVIKDPHILINMESTYAGKTNLNMKSIFFDGKATMIHLKQFTCFVNLVKKSYVSP